MARAETSRVGSRRKKANVAETSRFSSRRKKAKVAETVEEEPEQGQGLGQAVDRISSLPDPILVNILSLLPTRDAVKTLMIPSLGRVWDQTFNLDFDWSSWSRTCFVYSCDRVDFKVELSRFLNFVDRAMTLHRSPQVSKFRLKLDYCGVSCCKGLGKLRNKIDVWIESVVRRNVETLDLDFVASSGITWCHHILPASVLRSSSLVELRVADCLLKPYPGSCMRVLKYLYLKRVWLSFDKFSYILSVCPVLEKLTLEDCGGGYSVSCESPIVVTMAISPDVSSERQITVSGPYFASLSISGWIERINPGNLTSLDDATIDISDRFSFVPGEYDEVKRVFQKLCHAKVLTLHERPIVVAMIWELKGIRCPSSKCHRLVLRTMLNRWHLPGVANLLRNSPSLETLDLDILPGELPHCPVKGTWLDWYNFDKREFWTPKDHSFRCLKNGLKSVKISGDVMKNTVVKFVQFLLSKALVLEELIIFPERRLSETMKLKKYKEKVLNFPVASRKAVVTFR